MTLSYLPMRSQSLHKSGQLLVYLLFWQSNRLVACRLSQTSDTEGKDCLLKDWGDMAL